MTAILPDVFNERTHVGNVRFHLTGAAGSSDAVRPHRPPLRDFRGLIRADSSEVGIELC